MCYCLYITSLLRCGICEENSSSARKALKNLYALPILPDYSVCWADSGPRLYVSHQCMSKNLFFCACLNVNFYCLFFSFFCELGLCPSYSLFPVLFWRVSFSFSFVFTSFRCVRLLMWSVIKTSCSLTQVSVEPCHHWESAHLQLS